MVSALVQRVIVHVHARIACPCAQNVSPACRTRARPLAVRAVPLQRGDSRAPSRAPPRGCRPASGGPGPARNRIGPDRPARSGNTHIGTNAAAY